MSTTASHRLDSKRSDRQDVSRFPGSATWYHDNTPTAQDTMMSTTGPVLPLSGLLCRRVLKEGSAWIGMLRFPPSFVPEEGVSYAFLVDEGNLRLLPQPLDGGLDDHERTRGGSLGIGDIMTRPVWPTPIDPRVVPVRFITAFPDDNRWSVYGPSPFPVPDDAPAHQWWCVDSGTMTDLPAPFDAIGMGFSQILTVQPVWPGPDGQNHTLPQTPIAWRGHWLRYHELLADAAHDDTLYENLGNAIARDPHLRQITLGRLDRTFCKYLARLRDEGLLCEDKPQTAQDLARREQVLATVLDVEGSAAPTGRRPSP